MIQFRIFLPTLTLPCVLLCTLSGAYAAETWDCTQDVAATRAAVDAALAAHPEARSHLSDDGGIFASELRGFVLTIEGRSVRGEIDTSNLLGRIDLGRKDVPGFNGELSRSVTGPRQVSVALDGWDHYLYKIALNPGDSSASVDEFFDYDCGGDGSRALAKFSCVRR
jgi:hypothetical protein